MRTLVASTCRRIPFMLLVGALIVHVSTVQAQESSPTRRISVQGTGQVTAEPDIATVRFAVVTRAEDPETARQQNAKASKQALNVVHELEVPREKIRLEQLRLQPAREYNPQTRRREEVGFEVTRLLVVELQNLEQLPKLVARVVQEGANRLEQVRYGLQKEAPVRNKALRQAIENAAVKAQLLAQTAGAELGPVLQIDEQNVNVPYPQVQMTAEAAMKDRAAPEPEAYASGEITVEAAVQVVYELQ